MKQNVNEIKLENEALIKPGIVFTVSGVEHNTNIFPPSGHYLKDPYKDYAFSLMDDDVISENLIEGKDEPLCFFSSYLPFDLVNVTGNGTEFKIGLLVPCKKVIDLGSNFNTAFTAPCDGIYVFCGAIILGDITEEMTNGFIALNINDQKEYCKINPAELLASNKEYVALNCIINARITLEKGDVVFMSVRIDNGLSNSAKIISLSGLRTFFAGHIVEKVKIEK